MARVTKKIKWKNIFGLIALVIIVFAAITIFSAISSALKGDCIEKEGIKACFSMSKKVEGWQDVTTVRIEVTNTGKLLSGAAVSMSPSPNLEALSLTTYTTQEKLAPGDSIQWEFKVAPKDEGVQGKFVVEFDIDADGLSDKQVSVEVK